MTSTIWKFDVGITGDLVATMPAGAKILSVQMQAGDAKMWAHVPAQDAPIVTRSFSWYGTGFDMPDDPGEFVATVQTFSGLVFHLFETTRPGAAR